MQGVNELYHLAEIQDGGGIKEKLTELVPEYNMQQTECVL